MAQGDILIHHIEEIAATGPGIAKSGEQCIFVDLTAPGDVVKLRIINEQKNWSKAEIIEILEYSPLRIEPVCAFYGKCGGCNFQHLNYETQLNVKKSILHNVFSKIGNILLPQINVRESAQWEYRNRVQFHCMPENRKIIGFKEKNSNNIIPITDCIISDPGIREAIKKPEHGLLYPPPEKDRFNVYSKDGIFLSEGGNSRGKIIFAHDNMNDVRTLQIDAGVFFQSNSQMLKVLINDLQTIAKTCSRDLPMADIFCGVGTFSAFLGENFNNIDLVEENKTAIALARENVVYGSAGKERCFYALKTDDWIKRRKQYNKPWGLVIVDPPRTGLSTTLRRFLTASNINILAYVSCDPATLARDSRDLIKNGFELKELNLYDFYPQTSHIESLAVFTGTQRS